MNFWKIFTGIKTLFTAVSLFSSQISPPVDCSTESLGFLQLPSSNIDNELIFLMSMLDNKDADVNNFPRKNCTKCDK